MYNYEKLFKGIISVKETDGLIEISRFTDKQLKVYGKFGENLMVRSNCPAGVKMEFITEKKDLSFDFVTDGFCREWLGFDVYEDGILKLTDTREGKCDGGSFSYTVENEGKVKIEIYFMFSCVLKFKNIDFGEIEYIEEEKINYLALGDSITQGMVSKSASMTYPAIIGRAYNLNVLNHGVGGYWFDKKSLDEELPFCPDIITIAYGTNDATLSFLQGRTPDYVLGKAEEYIKEVKRIYPDAVIKIITPVWRAKDAEPDYKAHSGKIAKGLFAIGKELGIDVIDGQILVPHDSFYFGDSPAIHPNDTGFLHYAMMLGDYLFSNTSA